MYLEEIKIVSPITSISHSMSRNYFTLYAISLNEYILIMSKIIKNFIFRRDKNFESNHVNVTLNVILSILLKKFIFQITRFLIASKFSFCNAKLYYRIIFCVM